MLREKPSTVQLVYMWGGLGLNPDFHGEKPVTNPLRHYVCVLLMCRSTHTHTHTHIYICMEVIEVCVQRIGESDVRYLTEIKQREVLSDGKSCTLCLPEL